MGWIWLDDLMPEHPKILRAGPAAAWLHVCGIAYCNRQRTDGEIPVAQVGRLASIPKPYDAAERLVEFGLWDEGHDCYHVHDYADYQLTAEDRQVRSEAGRAGARKRWGGHANGKAPAKGGPKA